MKDNISLIISLDETFKCYTDGDIEVDGTSFTLNGLFYIVYILPENEQLRRIAGDRKTTKQFMINNIYGIEPPIIIKDPDLFPPTITISMMGVRIFRNIKDPRIVSDFYNTIQKMDESLGTPGIVIANENDVKNIEKSKVITHDFKK